jgi:uncharacterized membrane protein
MGVEDAAKLVISAGLVTPKYKEKTKALADEAMAETTAEPKKPVAKKPRAPRRKTAKAG